MKDIFDMASVKIGDYLTKSEGWPRESDDYQRMKYAIDAILRNLTAVGLLLIVSKGLGIVPYASVFLLAYGAVRFVSFGVHMPNPYACTLYGVARTIGGTYLALWLAKVLPVNLSWLIGLCVFGYFIFHAPAETWKRRIPAGQKEWFRLLSAVVGVLILLITVVLSLLDVLREYSYILALAFFFQTINLAPFMFALFEKPWIQFQDKNEEAKKNDQS